MPAPAHQYAHPRSVFFNKAAVALANTYWLKPEYMALRFALIIWLKVSFFMIFLSSTMPVRAPSSSRSQQAMIVVIPIIAMRRLSSSLHNRRMELLREQVGIREYERKIKGYVRQCHNLTRVSHAAEHHSHGTHANHPMQCLRHEFIFRHSKQASAP